MSGYFIFIWKCYGCMYVELWEEYADTEDSGSGLTKECPKCKRIMNPMGSLKKRLEEGGKE